MTIIVVESQFSFDKTLFGKNYTFIVSGSGFSGEKMFLVVPETRVLVCQY